MKLIMLTCVAAVIASVVTVVIWNMLGMGNAGMVGGGVGGAVGGIVAATLAKKK